MCCIEFKSFESFGHIFYLEAVARLIQCVTLIELTFIQSCSIVAIWFHLFVHYSMVDEKFRDRCHAVAACSQPFVDKHTHTHTRRELNANTHVHQSIFSVYLDKLTFLALKPSGNEFTSLAQSKNISWEKSYLSLCSALLSLNSFRILRTKWNSFRDVVVCSIIIEPSN